MVSGGCRKRTNNSFEGCCCGRDCRGRDCYGRGGWCGRQEGRAGGRAGQEVLWRLTRRLAGQASLRCVGSCAAPHLAPMDSWRLGIRRLVGDGKRSMRSFASLSEERQTLSINGIGNTPRIFIAIL